VTAAVPRRLRWHRGLRIDGRPARLADVTSNPAGARYIGRPSRWGNPYRVHESGPDTGLWVVTGPGYHGAPTPDRAEAHADAVGFFERITLPVLAHRGLLVPLAGMDLACGCPPGLRCHVDPTLRAANPDLPETTWSQP
jgi:hypothetical protein